MAQFLDAFWHFLYFLVGSVCIVFIVKYVCCVLVIKYGSNIEEAKEKLGEHFNGFRDYRD